MTTTLTRPIKATTVAVGSNPVAPAPKQRVPAKEMAPSEWAVLESMQWIPDDRHDLPARLSGGSDRDRLTTAVVAGLLAMQAAKTATFAVEQTSHLWGLYISRTTYISRGPKGADWPVGTVEAEFQSRLTNRRVTIKDLVAGWIGSRRRSPETDKWNRIARRLTEKGFIREIKEKGSFLFFSWDSTDLWMTEAGEEAFSTYRRTAAASGVGLPQGGFDLDRAAVRDAVKGQITSAIDDRTEADDD